jgi:cell division protein FtsB
MQLPQPLFERGDPPAGSLDDDLPFLVFFDTALPPVDGRHERQHVDAGSEPLIDQAPRQRGRVGVAANGREDEHDVEIRGWAQFFCCTHDRIALLWHTVKSGSSTPDAETTQPRRHRRTIQYVLMAVGCVLLIDALVGDKGLLAMMQARERYRTLEQSLAAARAENARLREDARRLRDDPATIEEIARRELGLIRPGEKLFIVKDVESRDRR